MAYRTAPYSATGRLKSNEYQSNLFNLIDTLLQKQQHRQKDQDAHLSRSPSESYYS